MTKPWLRQWVERCTSRRPADWPRRAPSPRPFRLPVELLEDRVTPAVVTWDGAPDGGGSSPNADWTTGANWAGDAAPSPGDTLVFPAGSSALTTTNIFPSGTAFALRIDGPGYTLTC